MLWALQKQPRAEHGIDYCLSATATDVKCLNACPNRDEERAMVNLKDVPTRAWVRLDRSSEKRFVLHVVR